VFDHRPRRRWEWFHQAVEDTPLETVVKWAIIVIAAVEAAHFIQGEVAWAWSFVRWWW
jgi:hypothetical protein